MSLRHVLLTGAVAVACGGAPPPPAAEPTTDDAGPVESEPTKIDLGPTPEPKTHLTLETQVAFQGVDVPTIRIVDPTPERVIAADGAAERPVRLDVGEFGMGQGKSGVVLLLDDHAAVRVQDPEAVTLGDLTDGKAVAAGDHLLTAYAVDERGVAFKPSEKHKTPFAVVHFWIGSKGAPDWSTHTPRVLINLPEPEIRGHAAAGGALVDFYLINAPIGHAEGDQKVRMRVEKVDGDEEVEQKTGEWTHFALRGLENGEYRVTVELLDAEGSRVDAERTLVTRTVAVDRGAEPTSAPSTDATPKSTDEPSEPESPAP